MGSFFLRLFVEEVISVKTENMEIILPEGKYLKNVTVYGEEDREILSNIYKKWRELSDAISNIKSRTVNIPEVLSEGLFCIDMKAVKLNENIPGANTSFDCYFLSNKARVQIKACSVIPDLSSFGPTSVWDEIYFMDFFKDGKWNGSYDIYKIDNDLIYSCKVNKKETFREQQEQKRRPRFSIYKKIIKEKGVKPIVEGKLEIL